jgi:hypothetical protein
MKRIAVVPILAVFLTLIGCAGNSTAPTPPPLPAIAGTWVGVPGGQADTVIFHDWPFSFSETRPAGGHHNYSGTYVVNDTVYPAHPKRIDLTVSYDSDSGAVMGLLRSIYQLSADSDTLVLAIPDTLNWPQWPPSFSDSIYVDWYTVYTLVRSR